MMDALSQNCSFFGAAITLCAYGIGCFIASKVKNPLANPLLLGTILLIIFVVNTGISVDSYNHSAQYISWFLTPTTVCLAVPLYEKRGLLFKHWKAILCGIGAGVIAALGSITLLSMLFGLNHTDFVTLLPKSITTAIAMGVSSELGGMVPITIASIMITGLLGNITAPFICRVFKIEEPIAKGIGIGTASHAVGTSRAMQMGETEGAMSSLSIVIAGLLTVILAPVFAGFY